MAVVRRFRRRANTAMARHTTDCLGNRRNDFGRGATTNALWSVIVATVNYPQTCGCNMVFDELTSRWYPAWCAAHVATKRTLAVVGEQVRILGLAKAAHRTRCPQRYQTRPAGVAYAPFRKDAVTPPPREDRDWIR